VALLAAGAVVLVHAFVRFVVEGVGTPAPVAPTQELVVGGLYRYVRNPMYLAVAAIVGQALVLGQPALLLYAGAVGAATGAFVHWYEQSTLARQFGVQYEPTGVPCQPGGRADARGHRARPTSPAAADPARGLLSPGQDRVAGGSFLRRPSMPHGRSVRGPSKRRRARIGA